MSENTVPEVQRCAEWLCFGFRVVKGTLTLPYRRTFKLYTWQPLSELRAAGKDPIILIPLIRDFQINKYAELQSVQVTASFCAGANLATIPWMRNVPTTWVAEALWLASLSCSIWAVIASIQTKSILDDMPHKDQMNSMLPDVEVFRMRRAVLRFQKSPGVAHAVMVFIWQFPSMAMSYAWTTFIAGLTTFVCNSFLWKERWGDKQRIALVYLGFGIFGLLAYVLSSVFVYMGEKESEHSRATLAENRRRTSGSDERFNLFQATRARSSMNSTPLWMSRRERLEDQRRS